MAGCPFLKSGTLKRLRLDLLESAWAAWKIQALNMARAWVSFFEIKHAETAVPGDFFTSLNCKGMPGPMQALNMACALVPFLHQAP